MSINMVNTFNSQGRNLYKLSQKITSRVLLGSVQTKINQKISKFVK